MTDLLQRIERFIVAGDGDFDQLAAAAVRFGCERVEPYGRLCRRRGVDPGALEEWRLAPAVPTFAFKSLRLAAAEPREVFRSSGTTSGAERRSVHYHPYPGLYRKVIDATFARACLPVDVRPSASARSAGDRLPAGNGLSVRGALSGEATRLPILSLIPDRAIAPDSSLSFMAAHVFHRHAAPGSAWAVRETGIDLDLARGWLGAQADGEPVLILATALALALLLNGLEAGGDCPQGLDDTHGGGRNRPASSTTIGDADAAVPAADAAARRTTVEEDPARGRPAFFRLPPGSRVFETGGFKGRSLEITPEAVRRRAGDLLGLGPDALVREYGMTELTSQAYSPPGGERLRTPPWMPFRVLDPETLDEVEDGEPGLLAFFDLANVGSVCHVLTEDLGVRNGDAFRLVGRASGTELRGCSLTAEELGAA